MNQDKIRFGDFEFDPEVFELRRGGVVQPLKTQSAKALLFLLQRPGRLTGRDALAEFIWNGRAVDAVSGINACIRDVRKALGDSAVEPRFVETLPKRGYRFIGDIIEGDDERYAAPESPAIAQKSHAPIAIAACLGLAMIAALLIGLTRGPSTGEFDGAPVAASAPEKHAVAAFLEGQRAVAENTKDSLRVAADRFREAVALDPQFAKAHAALAQSLYLASAPEEFDQLTAALDAALAKDPENPALHLLKGRAIWSFRHDWRAAQDSFRQALILDPASVSARMNLAKAHVLLGDHDRAREMVRDARAIDPQMLSARGDGGWIFYLLGENAASKDHCAESALLDPASIATARCFLDVYLQERDYPRAARAALTYMRAMGAAETEIDSVSHDDPKALIEAFSNWEIASLSGGNLRNSPKPIIKAISLTYLGRYDDAIAVIEQSRADRNFFFPFVAVLPELAPLYDEPAFSDIRRQLELSGAAVQAANS